MLNFPQRILPRDSFRHWAPARITDANEKDLGTMRFHVP
jgi:hypothetical protein